jgi:hypothetical protein
VAQQVAINGAVLRRAVENGEAFLQALFSTSDDPPAVYSSPELRKPELPKRGLLFNRVI